MERSVWIGWDAREAAAFAVARYSIQRRLSARVVPIRGVILSQLRAEGFYTRPTSRRGSLLWDDISDAPMSTEFACSRFLVPELVRQKPHGGGPRWALFMDCDMLVRTDIHRLFDECCADKAVMVVKHDHKPKNTTKMDGQVQTQYARKNWSSVMAFNVDHPANDNLTPELVNKIPGRDLHAFCWLKDEHIGEFGPEWNYLVGHTRKKVEPKIVHFTDGIPLMPGYENCDYADEWRRELEHWSA